jgi:Na+-driven multidrug efflux pump
MTAGGFMSALASISGKAYGAKDYHRQWEAFQSGLFMAFIIGLFTSIVFILFPGTLFSLFLSEKISVEMGREYLTILGFSQLFMCMELMVTGAFFGWGKTNIPAISGISLTVLRIPMALLFIHFWSNSLSSVWWSISISSIAKGTLLTIFYVAFFRVFLKKQKQLNYEPVIIYSK